MVNYIPKSKRNRRTEEPYEELYEEPYEETGHISDKRRKEIKREQDKRYMKLISGADIDF